MCFKKFVRAMYQVCVQLPRKTKFRSTIFRKQKVYIVIGGFYVAERIEEERNHLLSDKEILDLVLTSTVDSQYVEGNTVSVEQKFWFVPNSLLIVFTVVGRIISDVFFGTGLQYIREGSQNSLVKEISISLLASSIFAEFSQFV